MLMHLGEIKEYVEKKPKIVVKKCSVSCDEMHVHLALDGCVMGDESDVIACEMCELLLGLIELINEINVSIITDIGRKQAIKKHLVEVSDDSN